MKTAHSRSSFAALPAVFPVFILTLAPACNVGVFPDDTAPDGGYADAPPTDGFPGIPVSPLDTGFPSDRGQPIDTISAPDSPETPDADHDTLAPDTGSTELPACKIKADPMRLDFGALAPGRSSVKEFLVLNLGEVTCHVGEIRGPSNPNFTITEIFDDEGANMDGAPFAIEPVKRVKVYVQFTAPQFPRNEHSEIVIVNDSVNDPEVAVELSGRGPEPGLCKFKVLPVGTLNFGNVSLGEKKTLAVNFENIGWDYCEITQAEFGLQTGDWFSFDREYAFPIEVGPAATKKIGISCIPKGHGPAPDSDGFPHIPGHNVLNVSTTDPAQPKAAGDCLSDGWCHKLLCTGCPCALDVVPGEIDFGLVAVGCSSNEVAVKIYNNGPNEFAVSGFVVETEVQPSPFAVSDAPPTPFAIAASSSAEIKVKFTPANGGPVTGRLKIQTDAPNAQDGAFEVFLRGEGTFVSRAVDAFKQPERPMIDAVFCVDNSGSMPDLQQKLAVEFGGVVSAIEKAGVDYQIGVLTTEINEAEMGETRDMIYPGVFFQKKGFPRTLTNSVPHPTFPPYQPTTVDRPHAFAGNLQPGGCCSSEQEACMEAVRLALSDPLIQDDQANKGFLRRYAKLVVVMVSDEDDQSPGAVAYYADFLKGLKGLGIGSLLSLHVFAGTDGSGTANNLPGARACEGNEHSSPATRYIDLLAKLGYGAAHSICGDLAGAAGAFETDASELVLAREFFLSRDADPEELDVKVGGVSVPNDETAGWVHDPAPNSIVFAPGAVPPPGAEIRVNYGAACLE
jgi:hypothetical protein